MAKDIVITKAAFPKSLTSVMNSISTFDKEMITLNDYKNNRQILVKLPALIQEAMEMMYNQGRIDTQKKIKEALNI